MYCLGVKNAIGSVIMSARSVDDYRRMFFDAFQGRPVDAPIELAQHVVHGAVAYARDLGFEPHPDFAGTAPYLGLPSGPTLIRFGHDGSPLYISGPDDDEAAIARALLARGQLPTPTKAVGRH